MSSNAKLGWVILSRAHVPRARLAVDMNLTRGVPKADELRRNNRDRVRPVIDVRHVRRRVNVVGESGVSDARQAVADHAQGRARRQVQREVDRVEQRQRCTERVSRDDNGCRWTVLCE